MSHRPVALIVHQAGACALIKTGDRWVVSGKELTCPADAKICASGVCHLYPKLKNLLDTHAPDAALPDDYLLCDTDGCDAAFRMEFAEVPAKRSTRTLDRYSDKAQAARSSGPFLSRLPRELAAQLVTECKTVRYEEGEIILMQGVVGKHLYIIAEGRAEVAHRKDNDETILATINKGDCFGEMSILTGEVTSAEVRAKEDCAVLSLHHGTLEKLLLQQPVLSREFSKLLADRLKNTNASLESELNRGILGKLSMISLVDLVQTLSQSHRTGTLVLNAFGELARLGFRNGILFSAAAGDAFGDEAFYKVVSWPDGDFCFEQGEPDVNEQGRVQLDTMGLMMEAMRRLDETKSKQA